VSNKTLSYIVIAAATVLFVSFFLTWVLNSNGDAYTGLSLLSLDVGSASKFQTYLPLIIATLGLVILILEALAVLGKGILPVAIRPFAVIAAGAIELILFSVFAFWNYLGTQHHTVALLTRTAETYLGAGAYVMLTAALFILIAGIFIFLQTRQGMATAAPGTAPAAATVAPAATNTEKKEVTITPAERRSAIAQHKADMEAVNQPDDESQKNSELPPKYQ